jgi:hypothetical protein
MRGKTNSSTSAWRLLAREIRRYGPVVWSRRQLGRMFTLPRVAELQPIATGSDGEISVRMLANSVRLYEAAWAVYSFLFFSGLRPKVVFHNDGSLSAADTAFLQSRFPGCEVMQRAQADASVSEWLSRHDFHRCLRLRDSLVFAKKLFDVCILAQEQRLVLLDNDVLFYQRPSELMEESAVGAHVYQRDYQRNYCVTPEALAALQGSNLPESLNPGIMSIALDKIDFAVAEKSLAYPGFFDVEGRPNYFSELTLWAILISHASNRALSENYGFCVGPWFGSQYVAGHFCGGNWWPATYYYRGLPEVWRRLTRAV